MRDRVLGLHKKLKYCTFVVNNAGATNLSEVVFESSWHPSVNGMYAKRTCFCGKRSQTQIGKKGAFVRCVCRVYGWCRVHALRGVTVVAKNAVPCGRHTKGIILLRMGAPC